MYVIYQTPNYQYFVHYEVKAISLKKLQEDNDHVRIIAGFLK